MMAGYAKRTTFPVQNKRVILEKDLPPIKDIHDMSLSQLGSAVLATIIEDVEYLETRIRAGHALITRRRFGRQNIRERDALDRQTDALQAIHELLHDGDIIRHWCDCAGVNIQKLRRLIVSNYPNTYKIAMGA